MQDLKFFGGLISLLFILGLFVPDYSGRSKKNFILFLWSAIITILCGIILIKIRGWAIVGGGFRELMYIPLLVFYYWFIFDPFISFLHWWGKNWGPIQKNPAFILALLKLFLVFIPYVVCVISAGFIFGWTSPILLGILSVFGAIGILALCKNGM